MNVNGKDINIPCGPFTAELVTNQHGMSIIKLRGAYFSIGSVYVASGPIEDTIIPIRQAKSVAALFVGAPDILEALLEAKLVIESAECNGREQVLSKIDSAIRKATEWCG